MNLFTPRLQCRPVSLEDAHFLFELYADPRTSALSPVAPVGTLDQMCMKLEHWLQHWDQHGFGPWIICERGQTKILGIGGLTLQDFAGRSYPNLWYRFSPETWGKGFASEFAIACFSSFKEHHPDREVHALVQENNPASRRILEKLGLQLRGTMTRESRLATETTDTTNTTNSPTTVSRSLHFSEADLNVSTLGFESSASTETGFVIRVMLETDFAAVEKIQATCYGVQLQEDLSSLKAKWQASPLSCFVAQREAELIAYVFAIPVAQFDFPAWNAESCHISPHADRLYLHDMAVAPSARGHGVSEALLRRVMASAEQMKYEFVQLVAVQDSTLFWAKHGFTRADMNDAVRRKLASYGNDASFLVKVLKKAGS